MSRSMVTAPLRTGKELDEDIVRTETRLRDEERRLPRVSELEIQRLTDLLVEQGVKAIRIF